MLNPKQRLILEKPHKTRVLVCGYGAGKTHTSVLETYYQMSCVHPGYNALVVVPQVSHATSWINVWKQLISAEVYDYVRSPMNEIRLNNGSTIYLRHCSDEGNNFAGLNCSFLAIDEAALIVGKEAYSAAMARLRAGAPGKTLRCLITTTPNGMNWFAETFGTGPDGSLWFGNHDCWENEEKTICVVRGRTSDNSINLAYDYEANLRANNTPEWCSQYLEGEFIKSKSQVFHYFDPAKHIIDVDKVPTVYKKVFAGIDWGFTHNGTVVVVGKSGTGRYVVLHEETHKGMLYDKNGWYKVFEDLRKRFKISAFYCDPSEPSFIAGATEACPAGYFYRANNDMQPGINYLNSLFDKGCLAISSDCKTLIKEIQGYRYKEIRGEITNSPVDINDDSCDSLRYALYTDRD